MTWIPQQPILQTLIVASTTSNTPTFGTGGIQYAEFDLTKRSRIRNVFVFPISAGIFTYFIQLALGQKDNIIGVLGNGIIRRVGATIMDMGYNNFIPELIWDGNEKLLVQCKILNRMGADKNFICSLFYDLWSEQ